MDWMNVLFLAIGLLAGGAAGFYFARRYMMKYLEKNPPINEEMIKVMMMQMGRKPSQKQINQMMKSMSPYMNNKK